MHTCTLKVNKTEIENDSCIRVTRLATCPSR